MKKQNENIKDSNSLPNKEVALAHWGLCKMADSMGFSLVIATSKNYDKK